MPITDIAARNAAPREKTYRLADSGGMYLEVSPSGGKYWRLKYRFNGKEKRLALGVYPTVGLAAARKKRDIAREQLAAGIDPGEKKKIDKRTARLNANNSFEVVAREWLEERKTVVQPLSTRRRYPDLSMTFSHGSASGPSPISMPPRF